MAYEHAAGYAALDECHLVVCADQIEGRATAFAEEYDIDREHVFTDAERMVVEARPDIVSICIPQRSMRRWSREWLGADPGGHSEKPMADTWGDARAMARVCDDGNVQLTVNHRHRFGDPFRRAKELLEDGEIDDL